MAWFCSPFLTVLWPKMILRKRLYNQLQRVNNTKSGEIWLSFFLFNQWSHGVGLVVRSDPMYDGEVYHINKKLRHLIAKDRGLLVVLLILTWGWYRHSLLPALKKILKSSRLTQADISGTLDGRLHSSQKTWSSQIHRDTHMGYTFTPDNAVVEAVSTGMYAYAYKISGTSYIIMRIWNLYKSCILSTEFNSPPNLVRDKRIYSTRAGSMLTSVYIIMFDPARCWILDVLDFDIEYTRSIPILFVIFTCYCHQFYRTGAEGTILQFYQYYAYASIYNICIIVWIVCHRYHTND